MSVIFPQSAVDIQGLRLNLYELLGHDYAAVSPSRVFEAKFETYSDDQVEGRALVPPDFME